MTTAYAAGNLGTGYISSMVGANGECAVNTQTGQTHHWDVQGGGTYTVTLTGATDCDQGQDAAIGVVIHNSCGTNIFVVANQTPLGNTGVYTFQVTIPAETACGCTMPIEYCTQTADHLPANQPGSGFFAEGFDGTGADGHKTDLRVNTFDSGCAANDCATAPTPTPTPCTGSVTACKYYDFNDSGTKDTGELLLGWSFCLTSDSDPNFTPVTQSSTDGSCTTFSNLPLGTYTVTEGSTGGTWMGSTYSQIITVSQCATPVGVDFGNLCTIPSGGLTMGFWSNKNGQAVLQAHDPAWRTLLNGLNLRNATGGSFTVSTSATFTSAVAAYRSWLLGASATNMAYMLSAQLSALELDVAYKGVLSTSFDICSFMTISQLMTTASGSLGAHPYTPAGSVDRPGQESMKNCIDAINNNGNVVPAAPCDHSSVSVTCPPQ